MNREQMEGLVEGLGVTAEKVRVLHDAGATRSEIAAFLGIRYQHVHNVLKRSDRLGASVRDAASATGLAADPAARAPGEPAAEPVIHLVKVEADGRISLPPDYADRQAIRSGDILVCREESGSLRIVSRERALQELRELARKRMPEQAAILELLIGELRTT